VDEPLADGTSEAHARPRSRRIGRTIRSSDATRHDDAQVSAPAPDFSTVHHGDAWACKRAGQRRDHDAAENMHQMKYAALRT